MFPRDSHELENDQNISWCEDNYEEVAICFGTRRTTNKATRNHLTGTFKYGVPVGKIFSNWYWRDAKYSSYEHYTNNEDGLYVGEYTGYNLMDKTKTQWVYNKNSKREGWGTVRDNNDNIIRQWFFVNGVESPEKGEEDLLASYQEKCETIGFTPKTDKFAECTLRLIEMQSEKSNKNKTEDQSSVLAVLEELKEQREQEDKRGNLAGAFELMKKSSEMLNPPSTIISPSVKCTYEPLTKTTRCR